MSGLENLNPPYRLFVIIGTGQKCQRVVDYKFRAPSSEVRYHGGSVEKHGQDNSVVTAGVSETTARATLSRKVAECEKVTLQG